MKGYNKITASWSYLSVHRKPQCQILFLHKKRKSWAVKFGKYLLFITIRFSFLLAKFSGSQQSRSAKLIRGGLKCKKHWLGSQTSPLPPAPQRGADSRIIVSTWTLKLCDLGKLLDLSVTHLEINMTARALVQSFCGIYKYVIIFILKILLLVVLFVISRINTHYRVRGHTANSIFTGENMEAKVRKQSLPEKTLKQKGKIYWLGIRKSMDRQVFQAHISLDSSFVGVYLAPDAAKSSPSSSNIEVGVGTFTWPQGFLCQWPPTFWPPGTSFVEDNFSMDLGGGWRFQDNSSALHLLGTIFILLLHCEI